MTAYYMNDAMFDLPDAEFVDRSSTYLWGKTPSGADALILVERRTLDEDEPLRAAVAQLGHDAKEELRGYSVISERDVEVAGVPAIDVGARWRDEDGTPMYTRRVHVALGSNWMIFAGEVPMVDREFCDAHVDHIIGSLQMRE